MAAGPCERIEGTSDRRAIEVGRAASRRLAKRLGAKRLYGSLRATLVGRREPQQVWSEGVPREVAFWRRVLPERVATDPAYKLRADPKAPIRDPLLKMLIEKIPDQKVSIIDVGAGPLTAVGKTYPGKTVSITATDPFAREYARICGRQESSRRYLRLPVVAKTFWICFGRGRSTLRLPGTPSTIAWIRSA